MDSYSPNRPRRWTVTRIAFRALAHILRHWPLFLVAAVLISPVTPHMRIEYTYIPRASGERSMIDCLYFGARGWVRTTFGEECPFIAIIDTRTTEASGFSGIVGGSIENPPTCGGHGSWSCPVNQRVNHHVHILAHRSDGPNT